MLRFDKASGVLAQATIARRHGTAAGHGRRRCRGAPDFLEWPGAEKPYEGTEKKTPQQVIVHLLSADAAVPSSSSVRSPVFDHGRLVAGFDAHAAATLQRDGTHLRHRR